MKVTIVGGGGFLGRHISIFLRKKGISLNTFNSSDSQGIDRQTGLFRGSFRIPEGTETIIYLSTSPYHLQVPERVIHVFNVNVVSAVKLADLARRAKVRRYIYTSTGSVYAPSFAPMSENWQLRRDNWYSLSKIHAEEALSLFKNDMEIILLRPFGIYGPGQVNKLIPRLLDSILNGKEIYIESNSENPEDKDGLRVSLCYIEDAVKMIFQMMMKGGTGVLNLAGDRSVSIREAATLMGQYAGKACRFTLSEKERNFDLVADITRLQQNLNPRFTSLQEGLQETVDHALKEKIFRQV
jgi:nucleoside-diphosphate-sugar epimerase